MKKLNQETLKSRRGFLKQAIKRGSVPAVVVYVINKSTPPLFGREPL